MSCMACQRDVIDMQHTKFKKANFQSINQHEFYFGFLNLLFLYSPLSKMTSRLYAILVFLLLCFCSNWLAQAGYALKPHTPIQEH